MTTPHQLKTPSGAGFSFMDLFSPKVANLISFGDQPNQADAEAEEAAQKKSGLEAYSRKNKQSLPTDFADQLLENEMDLERDFVTLETVNKLTELYSLAMAFYESEGNHKYKYFANKLQDLLVKPNVKEMMMRELSPVKTKIEEKQVKRLRLENKISQIKPEKEAFTVVKSQEYRDRELNKVLERNIQSQKDRIKQRLAEKKARSASRAQSVTYISDDNSSLPDENAQDFEKELEGAPRINERPLLNDIAEVDEARYNTPPRKRTKDGHMIFFEKGKAQKTFKFDFDVEDRKPMKAGHARRHSYHKEPVVTVLAQKRTSRAQSFGNSKAPFPVENLKPLDQQADADEKQLVARKETKNQTIVEDFNEGENKSLNSVESTGKNQPEEPVAHEEAAHNVESAVFLDEDEASDHDEQQEVVEAVEAVEEPEEVQNQEIKAVEEQQVEVQQENEQTETQQEEAKIEEIQVEEQQVQADPVEAKQEVVVEAQAEYVETKEEEVQNKEIQVEAEEVEEVVQETEIEPVEAKEEEVQNEEIQVGAEEVEEVVQETETEPVEAKEEEVQNEEIKIEEQQIQAEPVRDQQEEEAQKEEEVVVEAQVEHVETKEEEEIKTEEVVQETETEPVGAKEEEVVQNEESQVEEQQIQAEPVEAEQEEEQIETRQEEVVVEEAQTEQVEAKEEVQNQEISVVEEEKQAQVEAQVEAGEEVKEQQEEVAQVQAENTESSPKEKKSRTRTDSEVADEKKLELMRQIDAEQKESMNTFMKKQEEEREEVTKKIEEKYDQKIQNMKEEMDEDEIAGDMWQRALKKFTKDKETETNEALEKLGQEQVQEYEKYKKKLLQQKMFKLAELSE